MIYVHVPLCGSFCTYCGFYSELSCPGSAQDYVRALCTEIRLRKEEIAAAGGPDTLYIGGGTPSVLPLSVMEEIVSALSAAGARWDEEFTIEVNPEDIVEKGRSYVQSLLSLGVSRVSMGLQSLDDGVLKWMNRRHDAATARRAYVILREAGVENVSVDLISGISIQSDSLWSASLSEVVSGLGTGQAPEHISAYQLSVEPESALASMIGNGRYEEASEDFCRRQYEELCRTLGEAGYRHYEISNFAKPGREAVHNSAYWSHKPYIGLGPAAHSFSADGHSRFWNSSSLKNYVSAASEGDFSSVRSGEDLTPDQLNLERIMLSLRTDMGADEAFLRSVCRPGAVDAALREGTLVPVESLTASPWTAPPFRAGTSETPSGRLRIPEECFFISDNIISELV